MENNKIPDYLINSYNFVIKLFPNGLNRDELYALIYYLYPRFSDRNLAIVLGEVLNVDSSEIYNYIPGVVNGEFEIKLDVLNDVQNKLESNNWSLVIPPIEEE